jgi:hypothetical protein
MLNHKLDPDASFDCVFAQVVSVTVGACKFENDLYQA